MPVSDFWHALPHPIAALAPMEDVTDTVFRQVVAECGRPDVMFTEFVHADVIARPPRRAVMFANERGWVWGRLRFTPAERPIIAQLWGTEPQTFAIAALKVAELGFDGIDLNMGCPARKIRRKGAGAALIRDHLRAAEIIDAVRAPGLPVSVKTRIGIDRSDVGAWIGFLLQHRLAAITVHGRLADQFYGGPVDWQAIAAAVALRDQMQSSDERTLILGNGDIRDRAQITERCLQTGADGMMVGRAVFTDPRFFGTRAEDGVEDGVEDGDADRDGPARLRLLRRHLELYEQTWAQWKHYDVIKRFYKSYLTGFLGAEELRHRLYRTYSYQEAWDALAEWEAEHEPVAPGV